MPSRGTSSQRGYGYRHQQIRKRFNYLVQSGQAVCWRCGQPIPAGDDWDLGHDDDDRTKYRGPEHIACNRATSGRRKPPDKQRGADTTRTW